MSAPEQLLDDLERLALRAPTRAEFFDEAAIRLKRAVRFDGACWHTLDPGSDLITQHRLQDIPDRFLLTPAGLGPELRSAFVADGATWGALILVRRAGQPEFEHRDVDLLARASALLARAVRRGLIAEGCESGIAARDAPGVIELDAHGGLLGAPRSGEVAIFIQRAHPTLVAPLLLKAYGLTPREQEVTQLILRGATTIQAAQRLAISPHTVGDHLKAIFDKTDARTRGELSAKLFFGEHLPRIQERVPLGDDASFIDAPRPRGRETERLPLRAPGDP